MIAMDTLQVITEPTRRAILQLLWSGEHSAGEIAERFDTTFSAVSQHLRKLREAGLVEVRKDGARRLYRVDRERLEPFRAMLEAMWTARLDQLAAAIEDDR